MSDRTTSEIAIHNRMALPEFRAGKEGPSIFSSGTMNIFSRVLRALTNPRIVWGEKDDAQITDGNFLITLSRSSANESALAKMYLLKSVQDDYVTAHSWDGTTEGATNILIAKEYKIQCSLEGETIFGLTHTYTYDDGPDANNVQRTNDDGTNSETEIVVPPWVVDEVIFAIPAQTDVLDLDGVPLKLLLIRSSEWCKYP